MKTKDLITIHDLSQDTLCALWKTTRFIKRAGKTFTPLKGKTLGMIFQKPSTRTRVSFEVGMFQLGGHALYLNAEELQMNRGETIEDTARTLSQYVDGIMIRANSHHDVAVLAQYAAIPVINGLSDLHHPCQVLSDMFTIMEKKKWDVSKDNTKKWNALKMAYIGDGDNVAHSLIEAAAAVGMHIAVATPKQYMADKTILDAARVRAQKTGATITVTHDPAHAVHNADVVYTDVWISMGMEQEARERLKHFKPYQINAKLLRGAKKNVMIMHCLPAHRGEEITSDVIDGPHSIVFEQAGNRLHVQKAIMSLLMAKKK